jgi:hypothetical protein
MENFQYSTEDEIYLHKKKLVENSRLRTQSKYLILVTIFFLFILLCLSIFTVRDLWICELDEENQNQTHICRELRKAVNCKTTVAAPIRAEVLLKINNKIKASAFAFCGWDTAISEIRICFIMLSFLSVYYAWRALKKSSKKMANLFSYTAVFFAILLTISSIFDYIQILDSKMNNYNLCNLIDEFKVESNVESERMDCSFHLFYFTIVFSIFSVISLILSSYTVSAWSKTISKDDY